MNREEIPSFVQSRLNSVCEHAIDAVCSKCRAKTKLKIDYYFGNRAVSPVPEDWKITCAACGNKESGYFRFGVRLVFYLIYIAVCLLSMFLIISLPNLDSAAVFLIKFFISIAFSLWLAWKIGEQYLKKKIKALCSFLK